MVIRVEGTPNPNAMKFTVDRLLTAGDARTYRSVAEALAAPLAARILAVPGVARVFLLNDFLTVTRRPDADWEALSAAVRAAIEQ